MDVIYGDSRHPGVDRNLISTVDSIVDEGTLYLGYPVLATADSSVGVDAMLVSQRFGVVAFKYAEDMATTSSDWDSITADQDRLFTVIESYFKRHDGLRRRRGLAFEPQTVTIFPNAVEPPSGVEGHYIALEQLPNLMETFDSFNEDFYRVVRSTIERVANIRPLKKRLNLTRQDSRGAIMQRIEKGIANLDRWQKKAAIETPDGPQRVRGLAGSGKTVVLALKAAYLHAQHPEWNIAVTYYSRSLSQQVESLVTRFAFEHSFEPPDTDRLHILHTWGGSKAAGLYTTMARAAGAPVRDYQYASSTYGMDDAFRGICRELLDFTSDRDVAPIYDAVLIDEAQDLPSEFFQLVYRFTTEPKRIVWAYDELQRLSDSAMPSTEELFGVSSDGQARVNIENREHEARKDIVLEVCYRNTPWALATAHSVGFGIYRQPTPVQHFDDYSLWAQIGYEPIHGSLSPGSNVTLRRSKASYPAFFEELLTPEDAVQLKVFETEAAEDEWIASQIERNLTEDELEHDDILVVIPDTYTAKKRAARLALALGRRNIPAHNVGVNTPIEQVFLAGSIAMTHIFRAKGNEAPMVYVMDAQYGERGASLVHNRNVLFTAITRSRAWVRICGYGPAMERIATEVQKTRDSNFELRFTLPTAEELSLMRRVHKDRPPSTGRKAKRATENILDLLDLLDRGDVDASELPEDVRQRLLQRLAD